MSPLIATAISESRADPAELTVTNPCDERGATATTSLLFQAKLNIAHDVAKTHARLMNLPVGASL